MPGVFLSFAKADFQKIHPLCGPRCERFKSLPVIAADLTPEQVAGISKLARVHAHYASDESYLPILRSLDRVMAEREPVVLNVSLAPLPDAFDADEPMNVATRIVSQTGHILIYAAGNNGPGEGTISPWAMAPWVIGVGACDESGSRLLDDSGIGIPADSATHPTVVACGRTVVPLNPDHMTKAHGTMVGLVLIGKEGGGRNLPGYEDMAFEGTSVAAPRVTRICSQIERIVSYVAATATYVHRQSAVTPLEGIRRQILAAEQVRAPGFGFDGVASRSYVPFIDFFIGLSKRGVGPADLPMSSRTLTPFPTNIMKALLQRMARPMAGYAAHQVGAGYVNDAVAKSYLSRLSTFEMLGLFFGDQASDLARGWADVERPMLSEDLLAHLRKHIDERAKLTSLQVMQ